MFLTGLFGVQRQVIETGGLMRLELTSKEPCFTILSKTLKVRPVPPVPNTESQILFHTCVTWISLSLSELRIYNQHMRANYTTLINSSLSSLNMVNHVCGAKRIEIRNHEDTRAEACQVTGDRVLKRCSARTLIRDFDLKL